MNTSADSQSLSAFGQLVQGAKSVAYWLMNAATLSLLAITVCLLVIGIALMILALGPLLLLVKGLIDARRYMQSKTPYCSAAMYRRLLMRILRRNRA
jgi:hypothetical protein